MRRILPVSVVLVPMAALALAVGCSSAPSGDYDADDDGLIEIAFLEQLDAVRWDLNGDGAPDAGADAGAYASAYEDAAEGMGCPDAGCAGYELARSLDFEDGGSHLSGSANAEWTQGDGWLPIGSPKAPFAGVFDGGGGGVVNLFIDRPAAAYVGLFGEIAGEARDLGLEDVRVRGGAPTGAFAGANSGTISGSYVTGEVEAFRDAGGLVGANSGTISGSYAAVVVSGVNVVGGLVAANYGGGRIEDSRAAGETRGRGRVAGGLAGLNFGAITGSRNAAAVSSSAVVGGLVGLNQGPINASSNTGAVEGITDDVGGIAGANYSPITRSRSAGDVSGWHRIGGLVGVNMRSGEAMGTITESYATGNVTGSIGSGGLAGWNVGAIRSGYATGEVMGTGDDMGGLVGRNLGEVRNSYATGPVSGYHRVGGLIGYNDTTGTVAASYATGGVRGDFESGGLLGWNHGEVRESYAAGAVTGKRDIGGFVGENTGAFAASYWDAEASGLAEGVGYGPSAGAEGKTTAELQSPTDYTGVYAAWRREGSPWDFGSPGDYPRLRADVDGDGTATAEEFGAQ